MGSNKRKASVGVVILIIATITFTCLMIIQKQKTNEYSTKLEYNPDSSPVVGNVHLVVSDLKRSVDFYQEMLGFNILKEEGTVTSLTANGSTPLLILEEQVDSVERPNGTTGLFHFAILLPDRTSLARIFNHLMDRGYPLQGASNHSYSEALYLADPDNNGIEIYTDFPSQDWKRNDIGGYIGGTYPLDIEGLLEQADTEKWKGLPDQTLVGHMHLQVAELKETEKFYVNGLGFDIMDKGDGKLFVSKNGYHHHIGLNTWAGVGLPKPPDHSRGLKQYSIFFTKEEIEKAKLQLKNLGFPFKESNESLIAEDPSGNQIQLISKP